MQSVVPTLAKKVFIGNFEPVKWKCRAPLSNGKLCERMDRYKCPFHGKIIGRDSKTGKASNPEEEKQIIKKDDKNKDKKKTTNDFNLFGDQAFLADIEAATGRDLGSKRLDKNNKNKKSGNLTDLRKEETPRARLEKVLLNSKKLRKVGQAMDGIEQRLHHEKFHHNFNYSIQQ